MNCKSLVSKYQNERVTEYKLPEYQSSFKELISQSVHFLKHKPCTNQTRMKNNLIESIFRKDLSSKR